MGRRLIKRVNNSIFTSEFLLAKEGPFASWSSYDAQLDCVLLRMTKSKAHEVASEIFQVLLYDDPVQLGCTGVWYSFAVEDAQRH